MKPKRISMHEQLRQLQERAEKAERTEQLLVDQVRTTVNLRLALLRIGAQHPVWNKDMEQYDALVNGWLASAREAVGAKGADDDAKAEWCRREADKLQGRHHG